MKGSELTTRLRAWRREYAAAVIWEGAVRWIVSLGFLILAGAAIDAAAALPLPWRWAFLGIFIAAGVAGFFRFLALPLMRGTDVELLCAASARWPELSPYLVSSWELSRSYDPRTSPGLAKAHVEQAEERIASGPWSGLFTPKLSSGARRSTGIFCACAVALFPWLAPRSSSFARLLAPWRETSLESWITVSPGDVKVLWSSSVDISARPRRSSAEGDLILWLKPEGAPWSRMEWDGEEAGAFRYRVESLTSPIRYRLQWRDQRSRIYALEPMAYPQLADLRARVLLPGQAKSAATPAEIHLEDSNQVSGLRGSWVVVRGRPTVLLAKAEIRVSYLSDPVALKPEASGEMAGGFPLNEDGSFQFDLTSTDGASDPHPVSYGLKATTDEPPTADLLSPAFEVEASPRVALPVSYAAHDDYGISSASLVFRKDGGAEQVLPIRRFSEPPTDFIGDYAWDLSRFPAGARIEFWIRVFDNCVLGAQRGESKRGAVRLADFESLHDAMERQWLNAEKRLKTLADAEAEARRMAVEMERSSGTPASEESRRKLAESDRALAREWPETADEFRKFSESMTKDPYANPGIAETAKALAQELSSAAQDSVPEASRAAQEGRWKDAERRHSDLEAQARKAARLMEQGQELQGLQDLWSRAQRMDQAGSELASSLSEMAEHPGAVSSEDRHKLDAALHELQSQLEAFSKTIQSLPKPAPGAAGASEPRAVTVPLRDAQSKAAALAKALAAGDYAKAARLAQQLSEELSQARQAIADAARASSEGGGSSGGNGQESALFKKMESAMAHWRQAVDEQARSLGQAQKVEEDQRQTLLDAQRKLLDDLTARQKAAVEEAARMGPVVPSESAAAMNAALSELTSRSISRAPQLLESASAHIQARAQADAAHAQALSQLARDEQGILEDLNRGASAPAASKTQMSDAASAADAQGQAQRTTSQLESELSSIQAESAAMPRRMLDPLTEAQQEQSGAVADLQRVDSSSALKREQRAYDLLDQGMKDMQSAVEAQKKAEAGETMPFGRSGPAGVRPAGSGGTSGAETGFVSLPAAEEYQPTVEMRRDLEHSLEERRAPSYDRVIKDYFHRISQ